MLPTITDRLTRATMVPVLWPCTKSLAKTNDNTMEPAAKLSSHKTATVA